MKKKTIFLILTVVTIFLIGLFLRTYRLDHNVPTLYADETGGHYFYQKEIQSGKLPILTLINYATFSYTWFLGLTPLGVRLPAAVVGSFVVIALFIFGYFVSKKNLSIAIISGFLGALLPWNFMLSRIGFTHIQIISFLGIIHLILLVRAKNIKDYFLSLIPIGIASLYYLSMILIAPIALALTIFLAFRSLEVKYRKTFVISAVSLFIIALGFFTIKYQLFNFGGRFDLAIWKDVNVTADSNLLRGYARTTQPTIFSFGMDTEKIANKIVYNYPLSVIDVFSKNYLSFFSPDFLFLKGDSVLRHSVGFIGEFYPFLLPFMLYGTYLFFKLETFKNKLIFIVWILASPLPAALAKDGATYVLRAVTLMPLLTYFCALGLYHSVSWFRNKTIKLIYIFSISLIGLFSAYYFFFGYFHAYPAYSVDAWEFGFKEVAEFTKVNNFQNTLITWDDSYPTRHFCFWLDLPFQDCQNSNLAIKTTVDQSAVFHPLSYLFFSIPTPEDLKQILSQEKIRYLVVSKQQAERYSNITKGMTLVKNIIDPAENKAFSIYLEK